MPNGSASALFCKPVLAYTQEMKRIISFFRARCAGWRGRVPLGVDCPPRTGKGTRSIAAGRLVRAGRLAASDGLPAGQFGAVRGTAGQHGRARARVRGGCAPKKGRDPALGRSRAGFSTQIHILADQRGLRLTGGQRHDSTQARALVEAWTGAPLPCLIADRAYDGDAFRAWREQQGIKAVIPARKGRTNPPPYDLERYPARNAVERGIGWLKHGRRVATRYDKYAHHFLDFLYLAGAWIWMQSKIDRTIYNPQLAQDTREPLPEEANRIQTNLHGDGRGGCGHRRGKAYRPQFHGLRILTSGTRRRTLEPRGVQRMPPTLRRLV